jgi:plastocyanin
LDKDIFYISLFMIIIGIAGQVAWAVFGGIQCPTSGGLPYLFTTPCNPNATAASFQEMQNVSGYMMLIGFILLPAGLFKDGLPAPGRGAKVFLGVLLILLLGVALTAYVSIPAAAGPPQTPEYTVTILLGSGNGISSTSHPGQTYFPQNITVVLGVNNTIEWKNADIALHSVTSNPGDPLSFGHDVQPNGGTFIFTFTQTGTYAYHCIYHVWMTGEVIVKQ